MHHAEPIEVADIQPHVDQRWPVPGGGRTADRWSALVRIARRDLPLVKLVEPHHDAAAILTDLRGDLPEAGEVWAVWAAEPPSAVLSAEQRSDGWRLSGTKAFCSGASLVTHALVTAETPDGSRLFSIDRSASGIGPGVADPWVGHGMARAATQSLTFDEVLATPVGAAGAYVARPGFWLGAIGIAACWYGGALGIAGTLEQASARLGAHGLAHLGAVRADLDSFELALEASARRVDDNTCEMDETERLALTLRARSADLAENVISHVGRALGPGPLAFDALHANRVADLQVFVRQHHAERDLERLGSMGRTHA